MRNINLRFFLSVLALYSITLALTPGVKAAPVQFNQVVQVVDAKPGRANANGFSQLRLNGDDLIVVDDETKKKSIPVQDDRVITETRSEIVEEEVCDCAPIPVVGGGFPYWTLGFAAVPFIFLIPPGDDEPDETPTTTTTPTTTPTLTPTPPTEPVPEPMTILLFGTGLASIGLAARRKFGKKDDSEAEEEKA